MTLRSAWRIAAVTPVLFGVLLAAQEPPADAQQPVFRADTEIVPVDVSVLDHDRQPVRGLTVADFTVLENGVQRPIETFAFVELPSSVASSDAAWRSEVPPDVATNRSLQQPGRLVVILMDRTIPLGRPALEATGIAAAVVDQLGAGDMAALVSTSGGVPQNFTADRSRLLRAINQRDWSTGISLEAQSFMSIGRQDPLSDGRCLCGVCVLDTVSRIADALKHAPERRKVLFFIGSDLIVQAPPRSPALDVGCDRLVRDARLRMLGALAQANVTIHSIDPTGLANTGPQARADARGGQPGEHGPTQRLQMMRDETAERIDAQNALQILPDLTGGRAIVNTNAPAQALPELFRESQSYYLLGFRPDDAGSGRTVRSIEVRVSREDVDVRARRAYSPEVIADSGGGPSSTAGSVALDGLLPDAALPLDVNLAILAAPDTGAPTVVASIDIDAFAPATSTDPPITPLRLSVAAFDPAGRPVTSSTQTLELQWPTSGLGSAPRVDALTPLALAPGDYEIRVAVENTEVHQVASVLAYATVPDFADLSLSLSTIAIATPAATSVAPEAVRSLFSVSPATTRVFGRDDRVLAMVRVYQGTHRDDALKPVLVRRRIVDAAGISVRDESMTLLPTDFASGRSADWRGDLSLSRLAPGEYLLRLDATMGDETATRAVRFSVR